MSPAFVRLLTRAALFAATASCATGYARIGETTIQFSDRYAPAKDSAAAKENDKRSPLVEGAIHHHYQYQGWNIRAAFLQVNAPAIRMEYQKIDNASLTDSERLA